MAGREWFLTKVIVTALSLVTLISICIGGANFVVNIQQDITRVDDNVKEHKIADEKQWDRADLLWSKAEDERERNAKDIVNLKLSAERTTAQYEEIIRRFDALENYLKRMEQ